MTSTWRRRARAAIEHALADVNLADVEAVTAAIDAAYPFGERAMWPYKMWLLERRRALAMFDPVSRPCSVCGAKARASCVELFTGLPRDDHEARHVIGVARLG